MNQELHLPTPVVSLMEISINRSLDLDTFTRDKVSTLAGTIIGIELTGFAIKFYLAPMSDGIQVLAESENTPNTWIRGTPLSLLSLGMTKNKKLLFDGDVIIEGDIELGQKFQKILQNIEIDWEEPLSAIVGDVAAHQIGETSRQITNWGLNALSSLIRSTSEYYQEETRDVVTSTEINRFTEAVDTVRSDTDRLESRFLRLKKVIEEK